MEKCIARHACYQHRHTGHQSMLPDSSKRVTNFEGFPFVLGLRTNLLLVKKLSEKTTEQECFFAPERSSYMQITI